MKTIKYTLADGKTIDLQVAEEFAYEYEKLNKKEKNIERKETRRHQEFIEGLHSSLSNLEDLFFQNLDCEKLNKILMVIRYRDRELFKIHYIDGVSVKKIAENNCVTESAIRKKLRRIRKKIYELWLK